MSISTVNQATTTIKQAIDDFFLSCKVELNKKVQAAT